MYLLMGILSALCWGGTDYLSGEATRKVGVVKALLVSQFSGLMILSMLFPLFSIPFEFSVTGLTMGTVASLCNLIGMMFLLKALSVGKASIVAPLVSLYGAITAILSVLSGKPISYTVCAGLAVCITGACLASLSTSHDGKREPLASVVFALMASVSLGIGFWLQGEFAVKALGVVQSLWIYYATALLMLVLTAAVRKDIAAPPVRVIGLLFTIGCLSLAGFFTLAWGASLGHVAVVTVLSSLASGVTALLGFFLKKERLSPRQLAGLFMMITGIVALKI